MSFPTFKYIQCFNINVSTEKKTITVSFQVNKYKIPSYKIGSGPGCDF